MLEKTLKIAIGLLIIGNSSFAQWNGANTTTTGDIYREGAIGIGTTTTPAAKLELNFFNGNSSIPQYGLLLNTNSFLTGSNADNSYYLKALDQGNGAVSFIIKGNGRVGIGNPNPAYPLDVSGEIHATGGVNVGGGDLFLSRIDQDYGFIIRPNATGYKNLAFAVAGGGSLDVVSVNSNLSYFSGSIGIGTTNFNTSTYKMAVDGKIAARGVKVTMQTPFPDYVFDSAYKLISLANVEQYINQNKHLPNIPSAEEVKKDQGIELGEMNVKLLEKVEELTLYIIELNKKLEAQQKEINQLKKSNNNN